MIMEHNERPSASRRKFFGVLGLGAAAVAAAAVNPLRFITGRRNKQQSAQSSVTITPNPMAVQRTFKGTAHNG
jgi:hypothetical protein